ncbi:MAG: lysozyme inhibitor LprI family protein [Alphaproteobacteria bacterium]
MSMKVPVIVLALLLPVAAFPQAARAQQAKELYDESAKADAAVEKKLNAAYQKLIHQIQANDAERAAMVSEALRASQRAWLKYREAQLQFVGLYNDIGSSSARAVGIGSYNVELTESRIHDLESVPNPF